MRIISVQYRIDTNDEYRDDNHKKEDHTDRIDLVIHRHVFREHHDKRENEYEDTSPRVAELVPPRLEFKWLIFMIE